MTQHDRSAVGAALAGVVAMAGALALPGEASAQTAVAAESRQGEPAPALKALLPQARLAGSARFTYWGFEVYNAALWVTPEFRRDSFWQQPFALELDYLRHLDGRAIAKRAIDEMQRANTSLTPTQRDTWEAAMRAVFPDVKPGDRITGVNLPGTGARFLVNGKEAGDIRDADFSTQFFGIWLASTTSEPGLRRALFAQAAP